MVDRLAALVWNKVLLGYISHIEILLVLGQQMIKGLIFLRAAVFWDAAIPIFRIGKDCIDIKDHASKRVIAML